MQVADVGRCFQNHLAVGSQDQSKHTMRARVLRAHVDQHLVGVDVVLDRL